MGQYYKPISLDKKEFILAHDLDNGLKLMEHSYIGNNMMNAVENMLIPGGRWYKDRIVWAGDYADPRFKVDGEEYNDYQMLDDDKRLIPDELNQNDLPAEFKFIVNHDKQEFIDRTIEHPVSWGDLKINPLSLLTADGNNRGGGDYRGPAGMNYVGRWKHNSISIEKEVPEGFKQIKPKFKE